MQNVANEVYILESTYFPLNGQKISGAQVPLDSQDKPLKIESKVGVAEKVDGTSANVLNTIHSFCLGDEDWSGYDTIVETWQFPQNKRFSLRVYDGQEYADLCKKEEPYDGANIFVKEIKIPVVNNNAVVESNALINIRVW